VKVSVLLVTFQSEGLIESCLQSVFASDARCDVVVVDNASTDATLTILKNFPNVRVIANTKNVGFSQAVNQAAKAATGDLLLLLNPDTRLSVAAIPRMVASLVRNPRMAAVGPISNNAGGLQSARHWFPNPMESTDPEARERMQTYLIQRFGGKVIDTKLLTGFCLLIRRERFEEVGGLDPELVLGFDDLDLCWRLSQRNHLLGLSLDAFVYHAWHKSFEAGSQPEVEAMHRKSLEVFSRKLISYYGALMQVPKSMDLWGVDWFEPIEAKDDRLVVCIPVGLQEGAQERCAYTVRELQNAGVPACDMLILQMEGGDLSGALAQACDHWSLRPGQTWRELIQKLHRWFGDSRLLLLPAGLFVNPRVFSGASIGCGPVGSVVEQGASFILQGGSECSHNSKAWFLLSLDGKYTEQWEIPWRSSWVAQSMSWEPMLERAARKIIMDPKLPEPALQQKLSTQLLSRVQGYQHVGVMGKSRLLDLNNQPCQLLDCDALIWKVDPLEMPGLCQLLRELRKNGVGKLVLLFDNSFFQATPSSEIVRSINPLDMRREVQQAGFRIDATEAWLDSPQATYSPRFGNTLARSVFTDEERLWATSSRLLLVATPCHTKQHLEKKVSVVLLALNQVEYTRKCIENLQKYCRQSLELILVNNGSHDGTAEYFDSIPGAIVIHNPTNRGVAAGWNQGMALATGDYVLILNNDTIPGPDCIENMVRCAENHPEAGMVVPRSNKIAGPQMVEGFAWKDEAAIPELASKIQKQNDLACWEFPRLKGFCMLMPRNVVTAIGPFDEQYGYGNFEDDDYSCRVRYSGYTLLVADDSFLFHFGSVSFKDSGIDWNRQMIENMDKFNRKWSKGRSEGIRPLAGAAVLAPLPVAREIESAFATLQAGSYDSAKTKFLQILAKNPREPRAAYGLGLSVSHTGSAKDAFAFLCSSLEMDPAQEDVGEAIVQLLSKGFELEGVPAVLAYLRRKYPSLAAFAEVKSSESDPPMGWQARVTSLMDGQQYSDALAILMEVKTRQGDDFEVCNLLGIAKYQLGVIDEASRWFEKALSMNPTDSDTLLNYYDSLLRLGIPQNAIRAMEFAVGLNPQLTEIRLALQEIKACRHLGIHDADRIIQARESNIVAENLIREGLPEKATDVLHQLISLQPDNYRALNNLGLLAWYQQRLGDAFDLFSRAVELNPWYVDALVNLYDCAFLSNRIPEFLPRLTKGLQTNPGVVELEQIQREISDCQTPERLQVYYRKDAEQTKLREQIALGHRLLEEQKVDSAVLVFSDLLKDFPDNVECLNGMGIAAFYRGHHEDAFSIFQHALQRAPLDGDTLVNYWDAAVKLDRLAEARAVLQNALAVDPSLDAIAKILEAF